MVPHKPDDTDEVVRTAINHLEDAEKALQQADRTLYRNGGLYPDQYVAIYKLTNLVNGIQESVEMRSEGHDEFGVNEEVKFLYGYEPE